MIAAETSTGVLLLLLALYFVPTLVAVFRGGVPHTGSIIIVNLFLGWTIVGWVIALAMAARTVSRPAAGSEHQLPPG